MSAPLSDRKGEKSPVAPDQEESPSSKGAEQSSDAGTDGTSPDGMDTDVQVPEAAKADAEDSGLAESDAPATAGAVEDTSAGAERPRAESSDEEEGPVSWKDEEEFGATGTAEPKMAIKSSIPPPAEPIEQEPSAAATEEKPARGSIPPRLHNVISYSVAAIWMVVAVPLENDGVKAIVALWVLHFGRRTLEALFVHRYSGRKVSPSDYVSEYIYYWGFTNWIAFGLRSPEWEPQQGVLWLLGIGLFFLGEFGNATAHLKLRALREKSGSTERGIPHGGMFELVSSPHYLFEIMTWIGFALLSHVWGAYGFLALGSVLLISSYALPRHKAYKEEFDGREGRPLYPENRKAIIPFVL